jgi:glycosyltransferase involved in cell wall biosynthesis
MKVLHVITGLGIGGAEMQLWSLLRHTRHEADVVTLYNPGSVAERIAQDGVRVHDLGMRRNTELGALVRLGQVIRAGRYDVVHAHLYRAQIYAQPAARLAGAPVVLSTEHSIGETHIERRKMTAGVRSLYLAAERCSDATIAVSQTVRERMIRWGVPDRKISVIENGVDFGRAAYDEVARESVRLEHGIKPDAHVIGVLGRLDPIKRYDLVIEAAAPFLDAGRKLLIIGDGAERPRLEQVARDSGAGAHVIFAGERHDVGPMLSALDTFVAFSSQETFGLSVLEALINGLPAIYSTCPALEGVSTERALRVDGTVQALRAALARQARHLPPQRIPEQAVRDRYAIESVTAAIDDLYERLADSKRRGRRALAAAAARASAQQDGPLLAGMGDVTTTSFDNAS